MQAPHEAFLVLSIEFQTREKDEKSKRWVSLLRIVFSLAFDLGGLEGAPMAVAGVSATVQSFSFQRGAIRFGESV